MASKYHDHSSFPLFTTNTPANSFQASAAHDSHSRTTTMLEFLTFPLLLSEHKKRRVIASYPDYKRRKRRDPDNADTTQNIQIPDAALRSKPTVCQNYMPMRDIQTGLCRRHDFPCQTLPAHELIRHGS
jgi:hypothetical protein